MAIRLLRRGEVTNVAERHYAIDEGDTKPVNNGIDENGKVIKGIITGSDLIEVLDVGGINTYIYSEKSNTWKLL